MGSKWQTWEPNSGHPALDRYNTLFLLKKERKVRFHPFHARPRSWSSPLLCFYSTHPVLPLKSGYCSSSRKSSLTSQGHHDQVFFFFPWQLGLWSFPLAEWSLHKALLIPNWMQYDVFGMQFSCRYDKVNFESGRFVLSTKVGNQGDCSGCRTRRCGSPDLILPSYSPHPLSSHGAEVCYRI